MTDRSTVDDQDWQDIRAEWTVPAGVTCLNHGSFGFVPRVVNAARQQWLDRESALPMDFYLRHAEEPLLAARDMMADFVGAGRDDIVWVDNATYAMNVVAANFSLNACDEVLLTDHEYGAVRRIWQRACRRTDARLTEVSLPLPVESDEQVVAALTAAMTERTRLLVISHITSASAIILPIAKICRAARERGVQVCIDGPHALANLPLALSDLDCDYFACSCHKWLCAPPGTGFLYVHPRHHAKIEPVVLSWGRLLPEVPKTWQEEFNWIGTRDMSAVLSVPAAIDFLAGVGWEAFRKRTHFLAQQARRRITELTSLEPLVPDSPQWYGPMITLPVPPGDPYQLRDALWHRYQIEVPTMTIGEARFIRVSCHLYTQQSDLDRLIDALKELLY
ncbi:MAG: aminotransferase class V-fold PLP-dependent enzyme [Pirellulales bacterium]